jgi:hypothetical protein
MSAESQTTNPAASGQPGQTPNERPAAAELRELDAALARLMGWTEVGSRYMPEWWEGKPPGKDSYHPVPEWSSDPAASAELKRWLWATHRYRGIDVKWWPLLSTPAVTVFLEESSGRTWTADIPLGPDPVAAECEALARCAFKALAGKGEV